MKGITITPQIKRRVYEELDYMGVSPAIRGYDYLADLICKVLQDPENLHQITYMYQVVGASWDKNGSQVERAIRNAIELVFNRMGIDSPLRYLFSYTDPGKGKPTNREFIATVANVIRREWVELESQLPGQTKIEEV